MTDTSTPPVVKNARQLPTLYFGLHFVDGLAEYREPGQDPHRVYLNEKTLSEMDPTFQGCPVYVGHVEDVDLTKLSECDGYVVRSFRNDIDGKHWVEFLVVSDKGHDAIKRGWKLSNAYVAESFGPGGTWNGIDYQREITKGKFEHLAIVPDPRYAESIVLDFRQFKEYNDNLKLAQMKIQNSTTPAKKETSKMSGLLKFFKKTAVDEAAAAEFEAAIVTLPSGQDMTVADLIKNAGPASVAEKQLRPETATKPESTEAKPEIADKPKAHNEMANMDHHVMVNGESKPLHEVMKHYETMHNTFTALASHHSKMANTEELDGGEKDAEKAQPADLTENADEDGGEKEAALQLKTADKTRNSKENFEKLATAHESAPRHNPVSQLTAAERGRARYGSN